MAFINWEDSKYSVAIEEIDKQHKVLVDIINNLHDAMSKGSASNIISDVIEQLVSYTKEHFSFEEGLMKQAEYMALVEHKKIHKSFIDEIDSFKIRYESGGIFLSIDIMDFLKEWLISHIVQTDRKYVSDFHAHGIK